MSLLDYSQPPPPECGHKEFHSDCGSCVRKVCDSYFEAGGSLFHAPILFDIPPATHVQEILDVKPEPDPPHCHQEGGSMPWKLFVLVFGTFLFGIVCFLWGRAIGRN